MWLTSRTIISILQFLIWDWDEVLAVSEPFEWWETTPSSQRSKIAV